MIVHVCPQGSAEWLALRAGIPTASRFSDIVTPAGKPSKSQERYLCELVAEELTGKPLVQYVSTWMDRGSSSEAEAVTRYEMLRDCDTVKVGYITNDSGTVGASPDRFVGEAGLLEIKVPAPHTHVGYLLANAAGAASVDAAYKAQAQGQLWIAEREWDDILSYHPEMPEALIRIERDEKFIALLRAEVDRFSLLLAEAVFKLEQTGIVAARKEEDQTGNEFLTDADLEWALNRSLNG